MNLPWLERLFAHMAWADERALEALGRPPEPSADARELFAHVLGAELVWLARLQGTPADVAVWPEADTAALPALAERSRQGFRELLADLAPDDLARDVTYTNSAGRSFTTPVGDILVHVALHGAYHRGQVARALAADGATPEPTDYIGWVRGSPAATRDDVETP